MCRRKSIIILLFAALFIFPAALQAADISVGASSWFAWWHIHQDGPDPHIDPSLLYGPVLSIGLPPDWSITAVFLYGHLDMENSGSSGNSSTTRITRYDSDLALNYSINRYIKLFGGAKIMGYTWDEGHHYGMGPAAGVGLTLPLAESLFLLWNASGMYAFAKERGNQQGYSYRSNAQEPGINTTLSLAYYFESASTTVTLGGRYQWFDVDYESEKIGNSESQFYGVTLSVVYSF